METFNNNKFLDILTSEDNVETVLAIFQVQERYKIAYVETSSTK